MGVRIEDSETIRQLTGVRQNWPYCPDCMVDTVNPHTGKCVICKQPAVRKKIPVLVQKKKIILTRRVK